MATDAGTDGDGRWMTYSELADARQITRRAAIRLSQRHRLQRMPGNDGLARVFVPSDMASSSLHRPTPPVRSEAGADDTPPEVATPFHAQALAALENAVAGLTERAEAAERRADAAQALANATLAQLSDERARADRLRANLDSTHADLMTAERRAREAEERAYRARAEAQAAVQGAEALRRADAARKALGLVARLRAAWRGE
jgi:hypothetical protein